MEVSFISSDEPAAFDRAFIQTYKIYGTGGYQHPYIVVNDTDRIIYTQLFHHLSWRGWKVEKLNKKEFFLRRLKGEVAQKYDN